MCTLSFIPKSNGDFILTSNRDEAPIRETIPPNTYLNGGVSLLYPKDKVAGGTWIGVSDKKRVICLLNGGFVPHTPKDKYRLSRGLIVTDLLSLDNAIEKLDLYNLNDIEPFTIIMIDYNTELQLVELVWDGKKKYISLKPIEPIIWSSSLLYSEEIKNKRKLWFAEFLETENTLTKDNLLHFHKTAGEGDKNSDLIMDRGFVRTKSITSIVKEGTIITMRYEDLVTEIINENKKAPQGGKLCFRFILYGLTKRFGECNGLLGLLLQHCGCQLGWRRGCKVHHQSAALAHGFKNKLFLNLLCHTSVSSCVSVHGLKGASRSQ